MTTADTSRARPADDLRWWRWAASLFFPLHLLITHLTIGLRFEHWLMDGVFVLFAWLGPRLRRLSFRCLPFGLTGIAYDNVRFLTHLRGRVHVADLYAMERRWFGLTTAAGVITLPEYFSAHTHPALDLLAGIAYAGFLYEVVLLGFYLYFKDEPRMGRFAWGFFLLNIAGVATQLAWPAAPPWYVARYGLGPAVLDAPPSAAGALRVDRLLGIRYFESFYRRNTNVFGAMPSLHVAYPVLAFGSVIDMRRRWLTIATGAFAALMAFSAVYLDHHWVLDVVAGALYAVVVLAVVNLPRWLRRGGRAQVDRA